MPGKKKSATDGSRAFAGTKASAIGAKRGKRTTWTKTKTRPKPKKKMRKSVGKRGAAATRRAASGPGISPHGDPDHRPMRMRIGNAAYGAIYGGFEKPDLGGTLRKDAKKWLKKRGGPGTTAEGFTWNASDRHVKPKKAAKKRPSKTYKSRDRGGVTRRGKR